MKKNWVFILLLSIAALLLAGTAAYFSVFGLTKLFAASGIGITILAASLEFAKLVTVSYVYRFWNTIKKGLRGFYVFAVIFIMLLSILFVNLTRKIISYKLLWVFSKVILPKPILQYL